MAKKSMYVCLGILALAVAYHLGATTAISQGTGVATGIAATYRTADNILVVTDTGDCYHRGAGPGDTWHFYGNIFGSVATQSTTWGDIKARFGD